MGGYDPVRVYCGVYKRGDAWFWFRGKRDNQPT